jgi:hypothetical protein
MAATDDKTNFYVDVATGSDVYGGSNAGDVKVSYSGVTSDDSLGGSISLLDNDNGGSGWGTAAVNDFICWDYDGTPQWAVILELSYGADDDVIRVDAIAGAIANATKNVHVGGAWATIDHPLSMVDNAWVNSGTSLGPITIWVKGGAYPERATILNAGTTLLPITLEGYDSTEGDQSTSAYADLPIMDGDSQNDNVGIRTGITSGLAWIIKGISVIDSSGAGIFEAGDVDLVIQEHCRASGNAGLGSNVDNYCQFLNGEYSSNGGGGIQCDAGCTVKGNNIYSNTGYGINAVSTSVAGNQFWDNTGAAIVTNSAATPDFVIEGNTIDGGYDNVFGNGARTVSIGIHIDDATPNSNWTTLIANNCITNCNQPLLNDASTLGMNTSRSNQVANNNTAIAANWPAGEGDDFADDGGGAGTGEVDFKFASEAGADFQPGALSPLNGDAWPADVGATTTNRATGAAEPPTAAGGGGAALSRIRIGM